MTYKIGRKGIKDTSTPRRPAAGQIFFCLMSTFSFLLILRNSDAAVEYMGRGLSLCANTVIPSLFPFMVISELLVASGAGEALGRLFSRPMRWFFGLSGAGSSAVVLGSMCGFPVGASTAVSLYDRNAISKAECEHLLTFSNNPSSAFLITAVGASLYGNRRLGVLLYAVVLGCSFLIGFLGRFFFREKQSLGRHEHPHFPSGLHPGGISMFTGAVSHAATGMLTVCAYVVFFSAITGALSHMLNAWNGMNQVIYALLCGLLEMSGGISEASSLVSMEHLEGLPLILTAAIAGWSGLSVHCQVITLCGGRGLSFKPYILAKLAQGFLCGAIMLLALRWIDPTWLTPAADTAVDALLDMGVSLRSVAVPTLLSYGGLIFGWLLLLKEKFFAER